VSAINVVPLFTILILCIIDYVQNTQKPKENMPGILQVLPLIKGDDNVLKCHKKKRMPQGKRKDFPRVQNAEWKPTRIVLNAGRLIVNV